jgi:hypothetical protein
VDNPLSAVFNQALGISNSNATVGYYAPTKAGTLGQVAYSQSGGTFTRHQPSAAVEPLYDADPNSKDVQDTLSMFNKLDESCPH